MDRFLVASVMDGVCLLDRQDELLPDWEYMEEEDFYRYLPRVKDSEVVYSLVSEEVYSRIESEYGIKV